MDSIDPTPDCEELDHRECHELCVSDPVHAGFRYGHSENEICHFRFQHQFEINEPASYMDKKFFSAHVNFETAQTLNSELNHNSA